MKLIFNVGYILTESLLKRWEREQPCSSETAKVYSETMIDIDRRMTQSEILLLYKLNNASKKL